MMVPLILLLLIFMQFFYLKKGFMRFYIWSALASMR
jgi:hypothetical protein